MRIVRARVSPPRGDMRAGWLGIALAVGASLALGMPTLAFANSGAATQAPASVFASPFRTSPIAHEMAVLTDLGISAARAAQALDLQSKAAETQLGSKIEAALAGAYAGVWFEPAAAKFHIGVTSRASRQAASRVVAQAGLTADVVYTPVLSTWAALIAAQNRWNNRLARLLAHGEATTGIDSQRNAVAVTLRSSVPSPERALLEAEAAAASVHVLVTIASSAQLGVGPRAKRTCETHFTSGKAYCEEAITSGVGILAFNLIAANGESQKEKPEITGFGAGELANVRVGFTVLPFPGVIPAGTTVESKTATTVTLNKKTEATKKIAFFFQHAASCTAGPMLINANETYMLTAGHCFGVYDESGTITETVFSEYPGGNSPQKEIGSEVTFYNNKERDVAEIKVKQPHTPQNPWTEPLPAPPVPALMAEWVPEERGNSTTPHAVEDFAEAMQGRVVCHEGEASGEQCGQVTEVNATFGEGGPTPKEHLVKTSSCSNGGDSGGPYFERGKKGAILMLGTEVGGAGVCFPEEGGTVCDPEGPHCTTYFEPLVGQFGILNTFPTQKLLTTATEIRKVKPELILRHGMAGLAVRAVLGASSSDIVFKSSLGNLECSSNVLTGELTANEGTKKDTGTFSELSSCPWIQAGDLPWAIELTTKDKWAITGTKEVLVTATSGAGKCQFASKKVKGSFEPGPAGEPTPLKITMNEEKFKLNKNKENDADCPKEGTLSGTWIFTSEGETVEDELT